MPNTLTEQEELELLTLEREKAMSQQLNQKQPRFLSPDIQNVEPTKSPISIINRIRLSFADDSGREEFLKEKFQYVNRLPNGKFTAGDDPNNLLPIDPAGLFNDVLGDMADIVSIIPVIAGQIGGATLGTLASPGAGTIIGGGLGAGVGQAVSSGIGKMLGVNEQTAKDVATDIAITTAFGSAGEALAIGTRVGAGVVKRALAPKLVNLLVKGEQRALETGRLPIYQNVLTKVFRYITQVPEDSTNTFFKYGMKEMNNPQWFNPKNVVPLVDTFTNNVDDATRTLGNKIFSQSNKLVGLSKTKTIPVDDLFKVVKQDAQRLGILDSFGRINKLYPNSADIKPMTNLLMELGDFFKGIDEPGKFIAKAGKKITVSKALQLSRSFGQKFENVSGDLQSTFFKILNGDERMAIVGLRPRITQLAQSLGLDDFVKSNNQYSRLLKIQDRLKLLDTKNPQTIEKFIKGLEKIGEIQKRDLFDLENLLTKELGKPGFLKQWELWNAGQDFIKADLNLLRFVAVGSILGGVLPFAKTPESKLATLAGAAVFGTPPGLRMLIRGVLKSKNLAAKIGIEKVTGAMSKADQNKMAVALLSQLLKQRATSSSTLGQQGMQ